MLPGHASTETHLAAPQGYVFLKTHKVAGTSLTKMLRSALQAHLGTSVPQCDTDSNRTDVPPPPAGCRACLGHRGLMGVAAALRFPTAVREQCRARALCPFWAPGLHIRTLAILREPVQRALSRYQYQRNRGWCQRRAAQLGARCAADHLPFVDWSFFSDAEMARRRLFRPSQSLQLAESVEVFGGGDVRAAKRFMDQMDVVGLTDRLRETLVVLARVWGLPLALLHRHLGHHNANPTPTVVANATFKAWMLRQSRLLQQEHLLYIHAQGLLSRALHANATPRLRRRIPRFRCSGRTR